MQKIKFFALGGLGENGKNMYVVSVDQDLFILDCGLKFPSHELFGIDTIIPDYHSLISAQKRIKGIFISHAQEDHIGSLPYIIKDLNVPIYASKLAIEIIRDLLIDNNIDIETVSLNIIDYNQDLEFGKTKISFFRTTHSIPESMGISIKTENGHIVYTSDFTFEQSKDKNYLTDFQRINKIASEGVLALLLESIGSVKNLDGAAKEKYAHVLDKAFFKAESRILVTCFSSDIKKIQDVINMSLKYNKKISIVGRKAQRIVDMAIKNGYINLPDDKFVNLKYINEKNKNDDKDLVVIVTGQRHEPFYMLQRMVNKMDRLININDNDTIISLTPSIPGTEKIAARTFDLLFRTKAKIVRVPESTLSISHATAEEVLMMINLFNPKYIIPVIGEYRHQAKVKKVAIDSGYDEKNIIFVDNGDVVLIDPRGTFVSNQEISTGDILIDGTPLIDNNDIVMKDREILAGEGVIVVICNVDVKKREIISDIEVIDKGFLTQKNANKNQFYQQILNISKNEIEKMLDNKKEYINWNELKKHIKNNISNFIYSNFSKSPIIIPVVTAVEM